MKERTQSRWTMADESNSYSDVLSRRRFVELAGVSGAAALAGCDGSGDADSGSDENGTSGDGNADVEFPDARHVSQTTVAPTDVQYNPANPNGAPQISHLLFFEQYAQWNYADNEYKPAGIEEWEFTGDTFEMTVREGLTWSNGDPVTSEDIATQLRIGEYTGLGLWDWTESIETPDDQTVVVNIADDVNPSLVEHTVFGVGEIRQAASVYGEYLEAIEENEDEGVGELQQFSDEEPLTNGPFTVSGRDDQLILGSRSENSPWAENINFGEYAFQYMESNQQRQQSLLGLNTDSSFSLFTPPRIVADFPDAVEEVTTPGYWGLGIVPDHDHMHAGDRAVRQAIAYVINRDQLVENAGPRTKVAPPVQVPIPSSLQEEWLGDDYDTFETYGTDSTMTDEAETVLEDAGYSRNGDDVWEDSEGNVVSVPITVPSGWSDWVVGVESAVDQLSDFGFDATVDGTGSIGTVWPEGDFTFAAGGWCSGAPLGSYPYFGLTHQLQKSEDGQIFLYNYDPALDDGTTGGSEADVTVPAMSGDGELTTNPKDRLAELSSTSDEATAQEIITELSWVCNQDLPMIALAEKQDQSFLTSDEWDLPDDLSTGTAQVHWSPTWMPRHGDMNYTG